MPISVQSIDTYVKWSLAVPSFRNTPFLVIEICRYKLLLAYHSQPSLWSTLNFDVMQFSKLLCAMAMVFGVTLAAPIAEPETVDLGRPVWS